MPTPDALYELTMALMKRNSGLRQRGNIDVSQRQPVRNPDGSVSTVRTISIGTEMGEVLIPTVSDDGRLISEDEAVRNFYQTGRHLGIFDTPDSANRYADFLHRQEAVRVKK